MVEVAELGALIPCVLPSDKVAPLSLNGFKVAKLLVGVSVVWSVDAKFVRVKLLPLPDWSAPKLPLFSKSK